MGLKKWIPILVIICAGALLMSLTGDDGKEGAGTARLLSDFEDVKVWDTSPEQGFALELSKDHVTQGRYALKAEFPKDDWPSINTKKLPQNWGEYASLALDVYNPRQEDLELYIRLDDNNRKRAQTSRILKPGMNSLSVDRSEIARKINASHIRFVVFFLKKPDKSFTLFFDNLRLVRQEREVYKEDAGPISTPHTIAPAAKTDTDKQTLSIRLAKMPPQNQLPKEGRIKVPVAKLKKTKGDSVLVSTGIPFGPGQLTSDRMVRFLDAAGKEIPVAVRVLARWPRDNSIRSLLVQFSYDVPRFYEYVTMEWGERRGLESLPVQEPRWDLPEGFIVLPAEWLCGSEVTGAQRPMSYTPAPEDKAGQSDLSASEMRELERQKAIRRKVRGPAAVYDQHIERYFPRLSEKERTGDVRKDGYYSTPHVYYQFYARSGNLDYFLAARKELIFYRENQIVLDGSERGRSTAGREPRYVYVQALADDYLLTGDPRSLEVAGYMADYLKTHFPPEDAFYEKGRTNFWTERRYAFPFLGVLSYYEISQDTAYLKAAEQYMEHLYLTQIQWPDRGGFIHNLYAHDPDEGARPDEYGGSPFMTGILLEPVVKLHRLTHNRIAADSLFRALDWMIREGLVARGDSFRYMTSDNYANSEGSPDLNLLVVHAFGYGHLISGYEREDYYVIGMKVFERGVSEAFLNSQKHFNQNYRSSGHFLGYVDDSPLWKGNVLSELPEEKRAAGKDILFYAGFEKSQGMFTSQGDARFDIVESGRNGRALKVTGKFAGSDLTAGVNINAWHLRDYPFVKFAYRIPQNTPVGLRARTGFGDWICLGGTRGYRCAGALAKDKLQLSDDGQWHELVFDAAGGVRSVLAMTDYLSAIQFHTDGNAEKGAHFWIDEFAIMKRQN